VGARAATRLPLAWLFLVVPPGDWCFVHVVHVGLIFLFAPVCPFVIQSLKALRISSASRSDARPQTFQKSEMIINWAWRSFTLMGHFLCFLDDDIPAAHFRHTTGGRSRQFGHFFRNIKGKGFWWSLPRYNIGALVYIYQKKKNNNKHSVSGTPKQQILDAFEEKEIKQRKFLEIIH
jgi:hypothetical protein